MAVGSNPAVLKAIRVALDTPLVGREMLQPLLDTAHYLLAELLKNSPDDLESLLAFCRKDVPIIVAFESVYSMCGTIASIAKTCDMAEKLRSDNVSGRNTRCGLVWPSWPDIAEQFDFEAHRTGNRTFNTIMGCVDIIQGTISKGLGTSGGYIAGSAALTDLVRSLAICFIFITVQAPAVMFGSVAAITFRRQHMGTRASLQLNVAALKKKMAHHNLRVLPNSSHPLPVMVGGALTCQRIADKLHDCSIYVQPINSPTLLPSRLGPRAFEFLPLPLTHPPSNSSSSMLSSNHGTASAFGKNLTGYEKAYESGRTHRCKLYGRQNRISVDHRVSPLPPHTF